MDSLPTTLLFSADAAGTGKQLLSPSDFTFVTAYPFTAAPQACYGMGLTCRRVGGQLRFLTMSYEGADGARLIEFALPSLPGQHITTLTQYWDAIWSPMWRPNLGAGDQYNVWWDEPNQRLWTTQCTDYPDDTRMMESRCLAVRGLGNNGTTYGHQGEWGFEGVGQRAIYGGIQPIPQWFRAKYGITQKYAVGWGGYTSRMSQGLTPSLGLMLLAVPSPDAYGAGVIPHTDFRILADHRSGVSTYDWYASGAPTWDRGARNVNVINYFDRGDIRPNPGTRPTVPPALGAGWLSPAPDGKGRFVWGDSYYANGLWLDGPSKQGFVAIASLAKGSAWYMGSTLWSDGQDAELHVFNPDDFGKVLLGQKQPWNVQPSSMQSLAPDLMPLGLLGRPRGGNTPSDNVSGMAFDASTNHLYLWCTQVGGGYNSVLVEYAVNL